MKSETFTYMLAGLLETIESYKSTKRKFDANPNRETRDPLRAIYDCLLRQERELFEKHNKKFNKFLREINQMPDPQACISQEMR